MVIMDKKSLEILTIPDSNDMLIDNGSLIAAAIAISPSPHQQKQIIRDLTNNSISKPGNLFFLISNSSITPLFLIDADGSLRWKKYTGFGAYPDDEVLPEPHLIISDAADRPGPIDNSNIVATGSNSEGEDFQLLDNLEEERDYVVVSQDVWEKLFEWYKGGPVLPSKMISVGVGQELVVEVYPLCLKLIDARDGSESTIRLSKKASLHELHERVCSLKRTDTRKVRIWDYFNKRKQTLLEDSTKTLEKSDLQMNQSILLEVQVDGILPTASSSLSWYIVLDKESLLILLEVQVDGILPTGFDMDSTRNEIKICVNVSALARPFFLLGFEPSDTVRIVKIRVNDLIFKTPIQENFLPFHPATREMVSSDGIVFGDDQTLASLYETCCSNVLTFKFSVSIKTTANVILLAPNPEIFTHLVVLNRKCEYLVLHVCWDMQSYVFLRTVRASYPNIPIVAVTDLDPHHLDLLTFLDTPPDYLLFCYGWDLSEDFDEDYITDNDFVNIEWLGLCPNDCEALHFDDDARPAPLPGFEEVIRMLRVNPYLRRKEDWLAALDWLDLYGKSVSFRLGGDFVSRKLSKKDWV
ncbi:hypothetical protein POM88_000200 [Heracleum sosnowskyi]|uniref:DUSP domain-containing protein n=1 Tax=Heracleum sosnowskyi TaxID=360622 RepID=A0AAD8J9W0_9APIA|nr:hypothetical protein POM88_000200 [Heracleum sosnowskyi]